MRPSLIAAASSRSTGRAARCCSCSNAGGSLEANSTSSWTRLNITVFLATKHRFPDVYARLPFQEKTSTVKPANPYPSLLTTYHSESHWKTPPTNLTDFLTWLDTTVMNPDGSRASWISFMDVCAVHASQEFLALLVETHAHNRLVYVPPNTTAVCQPLDRSHMKPFKAVLILGSLRWSGNPTPFRQFCQHHTQHCWPAQPPDALDPRRGEGDRTDASQHSSLVRHRLHRCRAG